MDVKERLKKWFPKPHIPQKRYLAMLGIALFIAGKIYVAHTPTPEDDDLPEKVRDAVMLIMSEYEPDSPAHEMTEEESLKFGEGYR